MDHRQREGSTVDEYDYEGAGGGAAEEYAREEEEEDFWWRNEAYGSVARGVGGR